VSNARSSRKPPANPLLDHHPRRFSAGVVVVIVLVLALAAGVGVQYWRGHSAVSVDTGGAPEPALITGPGTDGQGVTVGKEGARAHIDLYLDYRCPHCKDFEDETGPTINELVDNGTATVTYEPLAFVNPEASPRLANAFACAAAAGKPRSYGDHLFAGFEKSWTTAQLLELGKKLGIDDPTFEQCVNNNAQAKWLDSIAKAADARGVTGTPTVFVNDKMLQADQLTPDGIKAAVSAS
jgi:protein-disulfide isomerase